MNTARRTGVNVAINKKDISKDLAPFLKSFSYSDALSDEADTAEIVLQDRERIFIGEWFPTRGDTATVEITRSNWYGESGEERLPLGSFEIDEISAKYPPSEVTIKMVSVPNNAKIRSIVKSRSWENVKLSKIAGDVAAESGLTLFYDTKDDPEIKRAEQSEKSSLQFLQKICKDEGLNLKVADGRIIIFDAEKYESQTPITVLKFNPGLIKSFSATATIHEIYSACNVTYKHGKKNKKFDCTFTDENQPSDGMTLKINKKVESTAEAEKLAKKKLREKNKEEFKVSLTLAGDFMYLSGNVIELADFGKFSGRYIIEKAEHKISNGYEVSVDLRKCLSGY